MYTDPQKTGAPIDAQSLLAGYFNGVLSAEETASLEQWVREDSQNADAFANYAIEQRALEHFLRLDRVGDLSGLSSSEITLPIPEPTRKRVVSSTLAQLAAMEAAAGEIDPVDITEVLEDRRLQKLERERAGKIRFSPEEESTGPRIIVIPKVLVWLSLAAAIVMLVWVGVIATESTTSPSLTSTPSAPDSLADTTAAPTPEPDYIATLIDQSADAAWADREEDLVTGDSLIAQELLLEEGKATIVFNNGAQVVLTAPSRFSLIDGTASQLHQGQLSAFVPESGHGFEVMVPGGVITDLGTSFEAVVIDDQTPARVEVVQGSVTVEPEVNGQRGEAVLLIKDQFADVQADGSGMEAFVRRPHTVELDAPSTGMGLEHGESDPNWSLRVDDQARERWAYTVSPLDAYPDGLLLWLPTNPGGSHWLSLGRRPEAVPPGLYTFSTTLSIPEYIDPDTVRLSIRYIADNQLYAVNIGDRQVAGSQDRLADDNYAQWAEVEITRGFVHGDNTLELELLNDSGPMGLRAELTLTGVRMYEPLESASAQTQGDDR